MKKIVLILALFVVCLYLAPQRVSAQDPVKVDSKHYKVVFENDQVRVLRITYGPHEKSVMHAHPNAVAVYMTDQNVKFTTPDGKSQTLPGKTGDAIWTPAGDHLPENLSDKSMEVLLVELKAPAK